MPQTDLETLLVRIAADTASLRSGLAGAERQVKTSAGRMEGSFATLHKGVSTAIRGLGAFGIALGIREVVQFGRSSLDAAGGLGELAEQLGTSTEMLQVYQYAATQAGVSQGQLEQSLQVLSRTIGDAAKGQGQAIKAFRDLGISVLDAGGKVRSTDAVLADVADRLAAVADEQTRAAIANDLFGRAGQRLLPMLTRGRAGLEEFRRQAHETGKVLSDEASAAADQAADKIAALELSFSKLGQTLAVKVAPFISKTVDLLNDLLRDSTKAERLAKLRSEIADLDAIISRGQPGTFVGRSAAASIEAAKNRRAAVQSEIEAILELQREYSRGVAMHAASPSAAAIGPQPIPSGILEGLDKEIAALRAQRDALGLSEVAAARLKREYELLAELELTSANQLPAEVRARIDKLATLDREIAAYGKLQESLKAYQNLIAEQVDADLAAAQAQAEIEGGAIKLEQSFADQLRLIDQQTAAARESVVAWDELAQAYEVQDRELRVVIKQQELLAASLALTEEQARSMAEQFVDASEALRKGTAAQQREADRLNDLGRDLGLTFESSFEDAAVAGDKLRDVLQGIAQDLYRIALRRTLTEPVGSVLSSALGGAMSGANAWASGAWNWLTGGGGINVSGDIQNQLGAAGIQPFAEGGDPPVGVPSLVGEKGPEIFVPRVPGTIVPNDRIGAAMGQRTTIVVNQVFNVSAGVAQTVRTELASMLPRIRAETVRAVSDARLRGVTV